MFLQRSPSVCLSGPTGGQVCVLGTAHATRRKHTSPPWHGRGKQKVSKNAKENHGMVKEIDLRLSKYLQDASSFPFSRLFASFRFGMSKIQVNKVMDVLRSSPTYIFHVILTASLNEVLPSMDDPERNQTVSICSNDFLQKTSPTSYFREITEKDPPKKIPFSKPNLSPITTNLHKEIPFKTEKLYLFTLPLIFPEISPFSPKPHRAFQVRWPGLPTRLPHRPDPCALGAGDLPLQRPRGRHLSRLVGAARGWGSKRKEEDKRPWGGKTSKRECRRVFHRILKKVFGGLHP